MCENDKKTKSLASRMEGADIREEIGSSPVPVEPQEQEEFEFFGTQIKKAIRLFREAGS